MPHGKAAKQQRQRGYDLFQLSVAVMVSLAIFAGGARIAWSVERAAQSKTYAGYMYLVGSEIRNYYRDADTYADIVNEHYLASSDFGIASGIPSEILDLFKTDGVGKDYFTLDLEELDLSTCERMHKYYYGEGTTTRCSKLGKKYKFRVTFTDT